MVMRHGSARGTGEELRFQPCGTDAWERRCWDALLDWRMGEKRPSVQTRGREEWEWC